MVSISELNQRDYPAPIGPSGMEYAQHTVNKKVAGELLSTQNVAGVLGFESLSRR